MPVDECVGDPATCEVRVSFQELSDGLAAGPMECLWLIAPGVPEQIQAYPTQQTGTDPFNLALSNLGHLRC